MHAFGDRTEAAPSATRAATSLTSGGYAYHASSPGLSMRSIWELIVSGKIRIPRLSGWAKVHFPFTIPNKILKSDGIRRSGNGPQNDTI